MIEIRDKKECCGCSACMQVCVKKSITMVSDDEGFSYPQINPDTCVNCGLCEKICPILHVGEKRMPLNTLAAVNKDVRIQENSSSGGVFFLFS